VLEVALVVCVTRVVLVLVGVSVWLVALVLVRVVVPEESVKVVGVPLSVVPLVLVIVVELCV
jgi:hypothetical protein